MFQVVPAVPLVPLVPLVPKEANIPAFTASTVGYFDPEPSVTKESCLLKRFSLTVISGTTTSAQPKFFLAYCLLSEGASNTGLSSFNLSSIRNEVVFY
jgi:hypothetical protein